MSIEAYRAAWKVKCSSGVKLTLLAIADIASARNGYTCEASTAYLAEMVGLSERQIQRNIKELATMPGITVSYEKGRGNTNLVSIYALVKGDMDVTICEDDDQIKGDVDVTIYNEKGDMGVTIYPEKVTFLAGKGDMDVTQTINNHNNNNGASSEQNAVAIFSHAFTVKTAIAPNKMTPSYETKWQRPIETMLTVASLDDILCVMDDIIDRLWAGGYTVAAPKSIQTAVTNHFQQQRAAAAAKANGNGDGSSAWEEIKRQVSANGRYVQWSDWQLTDQQRRAADAIGGKMRLLSMDIYNERQMRQEFLSAYRGMK